VVHYHPATSLEITSLERRGEGIASTGRIPMGHCPVCGFAVDEINRVVPIELQGLICKCGGREFRFSIRSLKPNKSKEPTEWKFDLDVVCVGCENRKFRQRIANFFRLKRVKVGATGIDLELYSGHKS
jgi:hypothetical protein